MIKQVVYHYALSGWLLATKLYLPRPRPRSILRPRLIARLNEGLYRKLTLISAPAGFGKSRLVGEWLADCGRPVAWLSLDGVLIAGDVLVDMHMLTTARGLHEPPARFTTDPHLNRQSIKKLAALKPQGDLLWTWPGAA